VLTIESDEVLAVFNVFLKFSARGTFDMGGDVVAVGRRIPFLLGR
jgi:hypothetical protein